MSACVVHAPSHKQNECITIVNYPVGCEKWCIYRAYTRIRIVAESKMHGNAGNLRFIAKSTIRIYIIS